MKAGLNREKVYDLAEQFEFNELADSDRSLVLSVMTEKEYRELRATVKRLRHFLTRDIEPGAFSPYSSIGDGPTWVRFLQYPVELYKVAAGFVILAGLFAGLLHTGNFNRAKTYLAVNDTSQTKKTDTLVTRVFDTVRVVTLVETPVRRVHRTVDKNLGPVSEALSPDYAAELSPADAEQIRDLNMKNNIMNDSLSKDFLSTPPGYPWIRD